MTAADHLTIEEKASLTSGKDMWSSEEVPGIPSMVLSDGPHGLRRVAGETALGMGTTLPATCFPPAVGLAASWDEGLIEEVGKALGTEATCLGVSVLLGPGLNIKRSPMGGRNFEYASEDPLVAGRYGTAFVRGVQSTGVAATPKHFAVNNQETDRLRVSAEVSERALREIYLPAFEQVVRNAQPWAFMCSYNKINGTYASENHWLLTEVLRGEWGFDGVMMSDWGAVWDRTISVAAGLDLEMPPSHTDESVADAVRDGALSEHVLDTVAQRMHLLAERTAPSRDRGTSDIDIDADDDLARRAAAASIVLLANDGILPLDAHTNRIAVVGELARTPRYQGGGSSNVTPTRVHSTLEGMIARFGEDTVSFAPGYALAAESTEDCATHLREAVDLAGSADVVVACIGLPATAEAEGFDRPSIALPTAQTALLGALIDTGTPVVVVISAGGVVDLEPWRENVAAIVYASLLGQAGGLATADVLSGAETPSGHLTETFLLRVEDSPSFLTFPGQHRLSIYGDDVYVGYRGLDTAKIPVAFPFGHGLSYTTFSYSDLEVSATDSCEAHISFTVTNTGDRSGAEVPQIYVAPPASDHPQRPIHELRDFTKVTLEPGESVTITRTLEPRAFAYWDSSEHRWSIPAGSYTVEVGSSSRDIRLSTPLSLPGDGLLPTLTKHSTIAEWLTHPRGKEILSHALSILSGEVTLPEELAPMLYQTPLIKITSWKKEYTAEMIDAWVSEVNR